MKKNDLTQGKVINVLTALALPIMGSSLLQFTYNLIDMLWVGGLGSDSVASIGSSSFFIGLGYSINSLVVIGTGIKVSELVDMDIEDVDLELDYIYCNIAKNKRVIPLSDTTKVYLEKYIKEARPKEAKTIQLYLRYEKLLIIVLLRTPS